MQEQLTDQQPESSNNTLRILLLLLALMSLGPLSTDIYLPSLPAMVQALGSSSHVMQLSITINLLGYSLSQLVYGPYSDRYGRRPVVLFGLVIAWLGSVVAVFAQEATLLIIGRLLQGIGLGVGNVLMRAVLRDTLSGVKLAKIGSYMGMLFSFLPALAPILGGYVQAYCGWRGNFLLILIFVSLVLVLLFYYLPETNRLMNAQATRWRIVFRNYKLLLSSKSFMGFVACSSIAISGVFAYYTASPFLFQVLLGFTPIQYGWLAVGLATGLMVGGYANSFAVNYWSGEKIIFFAILVMLFSSLLMFALSVYGLVNAYAIMLPIVLFLAAGGLIYSNASAGALMPFADMAGVAAAMYGCLQIFGTFLTTLVVAGLRQTSQQTLALVFMLLAVAALAAFAGLIKPGIHAANADK